MSSPLDMFDASTAVAPAPGPAPERAVTSSSSPPPPARPPAVVAILARLFEATAAETGSGFFRALARGLARELGVRWGFACEVMRPPPEAWPGEAGAQVAVAGRARALAAWDGATAEGFLGPIEYDLAGTPCERAVSGDVCVFPRDVAGRFPHDDLLVRMGAQSYVGVPLPDAAGVPIGILSVLHDGATDRPAAAGDAGDGAADDDHAAGAAAAPTLAAVARDVLRVCAARAGAELVRLRAEEASRDSERRFHALAEASPVGVFRTDAAGRCVYVNPAAAGMLGMSPADAAGDGWLRALHPGDRDRVMAEARAAAHAGAERSAISEHRLLHPDGRVVWAYTRLATDRDAAGRVLGHVGTLVDVTERRLAEQCLRDSERRYQALAESSAVGIWQVTLPEGRTLYMNPTMRRMLELADGEDLAATGETYHGFFTAESLARSEAERARRLAGGSSTYEAELVGRRGGRAHAIIAGTPVFAADGSGAVVGMAGTFTDITERKRAEQALRDSELRLRVLAEQVPAILFTADRDLTYTSGVGGGLRSLGIEQNAYVGINVRDVFGANARGPLPDQAAHDGAAAIAAHERALAGEPASYEQDWGGRYFRNYVEPLRDAGGAIVGVIGVTFDVTERLRHEAELRRQAELLQSIFDHIPVMVSLLGPDGEPRMVNREFTRVLGWRLEDLRGRDLLAECYPDPDYCRRVRDFVRATEPRWRDLKTRVRDGRVIDTAWMNVRLTGGAILGIGQDITDRKRVEEELRESKFWLETRVKDRTAELSAAIETLRLEVEQRRRAEDELRQSQQRYASILNSQQTLVSRSDPSGRITYQNAAHQRVFGDRVGESVLARVHPDDTAATERAMDELKHPPHTCTLEQRCEVAGKWRTFLWQGGVVRDRHGTVIEYQGVGFDITDRRRAEEMLMESMQRARDIAEQAKRAAESERRAADEAREVAEFNRRLALEVDHRVRNNLAGLLGLVGAMREQAKDVRSFAGSIEGRLLAMSHVHQVLAETDWRAVDLKALVTSLLEAGARLCRHQVKVSTGGPAVLVSPRQTPPLSMILMEWFTNSCKYGAHTGPGGRLTLTWELVSRETPEDVAARFVRLRWTESGGPKVHAPGAPSLGTTLVQGFAKLELKGACELRFPEAGADHILEFPVEGGG